MNLIELAHKAQLNMRKEKGWARGVSQAMKWLAENKTYYGTSEECIAYLNQKIMTASLNALNNDTYIGSIALYSAMIDVLLRGEHVEKSLDDWHRTFHSVAESTKDYTLTPEDAEELEGLLEELIGARQSEGMSCDKLYPIPELKGGD